ncbi:MAG: TIGR03016 family PEP-CTERM system-associated outer membrane protein, partial [Burkholderiales bacterium]
LGNRYTQTIYRIAPSIQGAVAGTPYSYSLRDEVAKINSGAASGTLGGTTSAGDATTNALIGRFTRAPTPIGWELLYSDNTTRFASGQSSITQEIGRGRILWQVDPILQLFAIGGYENTQSAQVDRGGPVYGAGGSWRPTPRTSLNATWEHRFFGPAHTIAFNHRWPGFAIAAASSRDITTFPQLVAQFPGAGNVEALLNAQYLTRVPDAQARQQAVEALIRAYNLPTNVGGPLNFISQDLLLRNAQNLTFTLIGTRNALAAGLFYTRTEPLNAAASTVPSAFGLLSANSQRGFTLTFSQRLTPIVDANLVLSRIRSESLNTLIGGSSQDTLNLTVTQKLSAKTSGFVGARYQRFHSNISALADYNETGAFVGIDHRF